jgi:hypothetical protein
LWDDVVVAGVLVDFEEELPLLPPHPATAKVVARTARSVSMAVSGVRFMAQGSNRRSMARALTLPGVLAANRGWVDAHER